MQANILSTESTATDQQALEHSAHFLQTRGYVLRWLWNARTRQFDGFDILWRGETVVTVTLADRDVK